MQMRFITRRGLYWQWVTAVVTAFGLGQSKAPVDHAVVPLPNSAFYYRLRLWVRVTIIHFDQQRFWYLLDILVCERANLILYLFVILFEFKLFFNCNLLEWQQFFWNLDLKANVTPLADEQLFAEQPGHPIRRKGIWEARWTDKIGTKRSLICWIVSSAVLIYLYSIKRIQRPRELQPAGKGLTDKVVGPRSWKAGYSPANEAAGATRSPSGTRPQLQELSFGSPMTDS